MPRRKFSALQPDLLAWQAPEPVQRFDAVVTKASTVNGRLAKAISAALAGHDRLLVAQAMSEFLGRPVSKHMVDAYASTAREDHTISAPRFMALARATSDARLLQVMAEPLGMVVIEERYLPLIHLAAVRERTDELGRQAAELRRQVRVGGLL